MRPRPWLCLNCLREVKSRATPCKDCDCRLFIRAGSEGSMINAEDPYGLDYDLEGVTIHQPKDSE